MRTKATGLAVALAALALLALSACGGSTTASGTKTTPSPTQPKTAAAIVVAMKAAGLPIGDSVTYTASTDPNKLLGRPGQYTSKANFADTRLTPTSDFEVDSGGAVVTFTNKKDMKRRLAYLKAFGQTSAFAEYDHAHGLAILRLSHDLTPTEALQYEQAFDRIT